MEANIDSDSSDSNSITYSEFAEDPPTKRHKCTYEDCKKSFFRPSRLADHLRHHSEERPFVCEYENCGKAYHKQDALRKHKKRVHLKQTDNELCPVDGCSQVMQKGNLKRHMLRKHNSYRRFKFNCSQCQKGFSKETEYKNHLTEHIEIYRCNICEKVFKKGHKFRRHTKSHKNYECPCQMEFYDYNEFRVHKKTCDFLMPICEICGETFTTRSNLLQHYGHFHDKQSIEKFKCSFEGCTKEYNYKKNLNMHIRVKHLEQNKNDSIKSQCNACGKLFKTKEYLKKHYKKFHLNPKPEEVKPRKPRCDKGIPKISMITQLTGIKLTEEDNRSRIKMEKKTASAKLESILKNNYNLPVEDEIDSSNLDVCQNLSEHE